MAIVYGVLWLTWLGDVLLAMQELSAGLSPQAALTYTCGQLALVEGSFKKFQKLQEQQGLQQYVPHAPEEAALAAIASSPGGPGNLCCKKGVMVEVPATASRGQGKVLAQQQPLEPVPPVLRAVHGIHVDD